MKSSLHVRLASVALLLYLGHSLAPAGAQDLSGRELKKAARLAAKAFDAGRYGEAIELYDRILASPSSGDTQRGDALYASAMIRLSPASGHQDVDRAGEHLEELAALPRHPRGLEIAAVRELLTQVASARAEADRGIAELEAKLEAFEVERRQAQEAQEQEAAEESAETEDHVKSLESRLRKARAEASECRADLEQKEEALQKLRDALVGGS